jgi:hypothetical protein
VLFLANEGYRPNPNVSDSQRSKLHELGIKPVRPAERRRAVRER